MFHILCVHMGKLLLHLTFLFDAFFFGVHIFAKSAEMLNTFFVLCHGCAQFLNCLVIGVLDFLNIRFKYTDYFCTSTSKV